MSPMSIFVFATALMSIFCWYLLAVHRLQSVASFQAATKAIMEPKYNDRCKRFNESHYRCLANVYFIGASKCGTTSISRILFQHKNISRVQRRVEKRDEYFEIHRFDRNTYAYSLSMVEWADELASSPIVAAPTEPVVHYTPHYLFAPTVPFELRKFYSSQTLRSQLKFIISLRDPVHRTLSSYWFKNSKLSHGRNNPKSNTADLGSYSDFEDTIATEMNWRIGLDNCFNSHLIPQHVREMVLQNSVNDSVVSEADLENYFLVHRKCYHNLLRFPKLGKLHVSKSIYAEQLQRWFANFPSENFLILSLEQFQANPKAVTECILRFIGKPSVASHDPSSVEVRRFQLFGNSSRFWNGCVLPSQRDDLKSFVYDEKLLSNTNSKRVSAQHNGSESELSFHMNRTLTSYFRPYELQMTQLLGVRLY